MLFTRQVNLLVYFQCEMMPVIWNKRNKQGTACVLLPMRYLITDHMFTAKVRPQKHLQKNEFLSPRRPSGARRLHNLCVPLRSFSEGVATPGEQEQKEPLLKIRVLRNISKIVGLPTPFQTAMRNKNNA